VEFYVNTLFVVLESDPVFSQISAKSRIQIYALPAARS